MMLLTLYHFLWMTMVPVVLLSWQGRFGETTRSISHFQLNMTTYADGDLSINGSQVLNFLGVANGSKSERDVANKKVDVLVSKIGNFMRRVIHGVNDNRCDPPHRHSFVIEANQPLKEPPVAEYMVGGKSETHGGEIHNYRLRMEASEVSIPSMGIRYVTRLYNKSLPAPMIRGKAGDVINIDIENCLEPNLDNLTCASNMSEIPDATLRLPNTTNLHGHGLYLGFQFDNVSTCIDPGTHLEYHYPIDPRSGANIMWYHPHFEGSSNLQVDGGAAGLFLIEDPRQVLAYPSLRGLGDKTHSLIIQKFDASGERAADNGGTSNMPDILENRDDFTSMVPIVNGAIDPYLETENTTVRFKVVNAMNMNVLNLGFRDESRAHCQLHVLGFDGIFLNQSREVNTTMVPPGGRVDIVVQCPGGGNHDLVSTSWYAAEDQPPEGGVWSGTFDPAGNGTTIVSLRMAAPDAAAAETNSSSEFPMKLPGQPPYLKSTMNTEIIDTEPYDYVFSKIPNPAFVAQNGTGSFFINGWPFNGSIGHKMTTGVVQEFHLSVAPQTLKSTEPNTVHPFHQHDTHFQLQPDSTFLSPALGLAGEWRDVIPTYPAANWSIRFTPKNPGIMVSHCHILDHEDQGMLFFGMVVDGEKVKKAKKKET